MASAQNLQTALDHFGEGRLDEALTELTALRESAVEEPATLVTAHVYLGVIHATMGDEPLARRDFSVALAIDPQLIAPSELSPSLRRIFDEVRGQTEPLSVEIEAPEAVAGAAFGLVVQVEHAPHLFRAVRVRAVPEDGDAWVGRLENRATELQVPATAWNGGARLSIVVEVLTPYGGVLARETRSVEGSLPGVAAAVGTAGASPLHSDTPTDSGGGSVVEEAWFWILIGTVVAGGVAAAILIPTVGTQTVYQLEAPRLEFEGM